MTCYTKDIANHVLIKEEWSMKATEFETYMRAFENSNDPRIHPSMNVVVRIDGRNFSKLTRRTLKLKPFDTKLRDTMIYTTMDLMENSGFRIDQGFTQSDEISLLLNPTEIHKTFNGKIRKIISLLAAQASVTFTRQMQIQGIFDARVIQLPTKAIVKDYFRWRKTDTEINCLNQWCYYHLVNTDGKTPYAAQVELNGKGFDWKNEYLFQKGINFNNLPTWQKQGIDITWQVYQKKGYNPLTKESVTTPKLKLVSSLQEEGLHPFATIDI